MSQQPTILFENDVVLVRLMTLAPNEIGQKHYHSRVSETVICTEGTMALHADDHQSVELSRGQQASVPPQQPHHVQNLGLKIARYIIIQTGGAYDFLLVE